MVALDSEYEVIRPAKLWCDTESAAEAAELSASLDVPIVASYTASKLLWLKRSEPDAWARLAHLAPHVGRLARAASRVLGRRAQAGAVLREHVCALDEVLQRRAAGVSP